jgi:hypothetical protein
MKLGDLTTIKTNFQNADFWIIRRGSINTVGKPTKEYNPEHIGIKVNSDQVVPDYLYYWFMNFHNMGYWKEVATGTTNLVNIRAQDVKNIPLST